jgi:hypothetical protein
MTINPDIPLSVHGPTARYEELDGKPKTTLKDIGERAQWPGQGSCATRPAVAVPISGLGDAEAGLVRATAG